MLALLGSALYRLTPLALEPLRAGTLSAGQLALYLGWCLLNGYAEGYRGFQRAFVPRTVARAQHLMQNPRPLHVSLAPLFCMGLFHATRKRLIVSWSLVLGISLLVTLVRGLPQPWRGIVDGGVVVGLLYGAIALLAHFLAVLGGRPVTVSPEVPGPAPAPPAPPRSGP